MGVMGLMGLMGIVRLGGWSGVGGVGAAFRGDFVAAGGGPRRGGDGRGRGGGRLRRGCGRSGRMWDVGLGTWDLRPLIRGWWRLGTCQKNTGCVWLCQ